MGTPRRLVLVAGILAAPLFASAQDAGFEPLLHYMPCDACDGQTYLAAVGDFDGNGTGDVAAMVFDGTANTRQVHVLRSDGRGGFTEPLVHTLAAESWLLPSGIQSRDFDGDGDDELLLTDAFEHLLLSHEAGALDVELIAGEAQPADAGSAVADFDGDGALDIVTHVAWDATQGSDDTISKLVAHYGDGAGGIREKRVIATEEYEKVSSLVAGDLDGDGLPDLAMAVNAWDFGAQQRHRRLEVRYSTGEGFSAPVRIEFMGLRVGYRDIAIGDFDADGRNDLAAIDELIRYWIDPVLKLRPHYRIDFFHQLPDGSLALAPIYRFAPGYPRAPLAADHDLDGDDDLLMLHTSWGALGLYTQVEGQLETIVQTPLEVSDFEHHSLALGDVDGDGCPDAAIAARYDGLLVLRGTQCPRRRAATDFDGDGTSDLLWRHAGTGSLALWPSGRGEEGSGLGAVDLAWSVAGTGDFDGDGTTDVLWRNRDTGANAVWDGADKRESRELRRVSSQDWQVAGVGDFDGDGRDDVFWRNARTGANAIWPGGDAGTQPAVANVGNLAWQVAGTGDFDGDGRDDVFWRNDANGAHALWNGGSRADQRAVRGVRNQAWQVAGTGDFDGDGRADLFWRNDETGANVIWDGADYDAQTAVMGVRNLEWMVAAVGDYDGDRSADVLWRNTGTGANVIWGGADADARRSADDAAIAWEVQR